MRKPINNYVTYVVNLPGVKKIEMYLLVIVIILSNYQLIKKYVFIKNIFYFNQGTSFSGKNVFNIPMKQRYNIVVKFP